jgi:hypothetical protein
MSTETLDRIISPYTARLFALPSFLSGVARILDLGATFSAYNISRTEEEADRDSIQSDWSAVGHDIRAAMSKIEK